MDSQYAQKILDELVSSANAGAYTTHMDLISKEVLVYGLPGFHVIGYEDWARQCLHEFEEGVLKRVSYEGLQMVTVTSDKIVFKTTETVEGSDGTINRLGLEILIRRESDGKWRVWQERVLTDDEMELDRHKTH